MAGISIEVFNTLTSSRAALLSAGIPVTHPSVVQIDGELNKYPKMREKTWVNEIDEVFLAYRAKVKRLKDEPTYNVEHFVADVKTQRAIMDSLLSKAPTA